MNNKKVKIPTETYKLIVNSDGKDTITQNI